MGPDPRPSHLAHSLTLTPITDKKVKLQETPELTGCEHEKFDLKDLKRLLRRLSRDAVSEANYMHRYGSEIARERAKSELKFDIREATKTLAPMLKMIKPINLIIKPKISELRASLMQAALL